MLQRSILCLLFCLGFISNAFAASESANYRLNESIVNAAGNTYSGSTARLYDSLGEPAIGQGFGSQYSIQAGFFNNYFLPPPTPTTTPTPEPTAPVTTTPLPSIGDFQGQIVDPKYFYVAPNPARGTDVNFKFFLKQPAEVEIRIYTPQGSHVLTKSFNYYAQGWNTVVWNASGMANGVYFYVVEAKVNGITEKLKVKKLALVK